MEPITTADRYRGALLGLACGDALGTTVEFRARGTFEPLTTIVGGGPFQLAAGEWTDDTSMALCLAESLIERRGFDARDQLQRYVRWWHEGHLSSNGRCFDIGTTVRTALERFQRDGVLTASTDPATAGNGSLMRVAPIPLAWRHDPAAAADHAGRSSLTTHAAPTAVDACRLFARLLVGALNGMDRESLFGQLMTSAEDVATEEIRAIASGAFRSRDAAAIHGSGYVVHSLEAALWCFFSTETFEDACRAASNLGDDADTTAAIVGQLAGAVYGVAAIPGEWLDVVARRPLIESMADALLELSRELERRSQRVAAPPPPYSYGSRDVQPGYESQGWNSRDEPWGRDPWTDSD